MLQFGLTGTATTTQKPAPAPAAPPPVTVLEKAHFWRALGVGFESDFLNFLHRDLPKIIFVVLLTWLLIWLLNFFTNKIKRFADTSAAAGRSAQIKTLSSVIKAAGYGILIFHALVEILVIFNINVTPLLASAGVAGVAIGFGAQTIVKDVINGMLLLVENWLNVGDLVTAAGSTGFVEQISLRRIVLRDGDTGALYIIPNSQITTLTNRTRDLGKVIVKIPVDNGEDPDRVLAILKRVAAEVAAEPQFAKSLRQPPEVWGVDQVDGSSMTIPVVFVTDVQQQWALSRDFRRRVLLAFNKEGIQLSGYSRVVNMPLSGGGAATAQPPAAPQGGGNSGTPGNSSAALDQTPGAKPS